MDQQEENLRKANKIYEGKDNPQAKQNKIGAKHNILITFYTRAIH